MGLHAEEAGQRGEHGRFDAENSELGEEEKEEALAPDGVKCYAYS